MDDGAVVYLIGPKPHVRCALRYKSFLKLCDQLAMKNLRRPKKVEVTIQQDLVNTKAFFSRNPKQQRMRWGLNTGCFHKKKNLLIWDCAFLFFFFLSFLFSFFFFKLLKEVQTKLKFLRNLPTLKYGIQHVEVQGANNMNVTHNTPVIFWNVLYFTVTNFVFQECVNF